MPALSVYQTASKCSSGIGGTRQMANLSAPLLVLPAACCLLLTLSLRRQFHHLKEKLTMLVHYTKLAY